MVETLGSIGLGKLGLPIAENLVADGFSLRIYNRTAEKAAGLAVKGATVSKSAVDTAAGGMVVSIVTDDSGRSRSGE